MQATYPPKIWERMNLIVRQLQADNEKKGRIIPDCLRDGKAAKYDTDDCD